jgi:hypothetical protein
LRPGFGCNQIFQPILDVAWRWLGRLNRHFKIQDLIDKLAEGALYCLTLHRHLVCIIDFADAD